MQLVCVLSLLLRRKMLSTCGRISFKRNKGNVLCLPCVGGKNRSRLRGLHSCEEGRKSLFAFEKRCVADWYGIRTAIPDARILELRGGAKWRYRDADIIVATTHQTLRFFRAFDLVILDEVDAFPYRGSRILHYAVRRATAQHGKTVFMTATPDRELLQKADRGEMALVRISARYHGRPLPEPETPRYPPLLRLHGFEGKAGIAVENRKTIGADFVSG